VHWDTRSHGTVRTSDHERFCVRDDEVEVDARVGFATSGVLKRSEDRGWGTTVKWLSGLSLCVCVRTCFVGCPKVCRPLPTESTSQIVPTGPSAPPSRANTNAHALAPNRITPQIKNHYSAFSLQENRLQKNMGRESSIPVRVGHFFFILSRISCLL